MAAAAPVAIFSPFFVSDLVSAATAWMALTSNSVIRVEKRWRNGRNWVDSPSPSTLSISLSRCVDNDDDTEATTIGMQTAVAAPPVE